VDTRAIIKTLMARLIGEGGRGEASLAFRKDLTPKENSLQRITGWADGALVQAAISQLSLD
jgi:hypothetical protein